MWMMEEGFWSKVLLFDVARSLELRRLQREDRVPRNAQPRARNTADLLARYRAQGVDVDANSRTVRQSEPIEDLQNEQQPRTTREFGLPSFAKKNTGYQRLG
jgi:hypothetical protein